MTEQKVIGAKQIITLYLGSKYKNILDLYSEVGTFIFLRMYVSNIKQL